jgi:CheY-like chemotaxis protein
MKILIADDNALVRSAMGSTFEERGHTVSEARDGAEALEAIRAHSFDAVLMDLMMPRMGGLEATRALRQEPVYAALPVFAFSGMLDMEGFDPALFTRVFPKPIAPAEVVIAIEKSLARNN